MTDVFFTTAFAHHKVFESRLIACLVLLGTEIECQPLCVCVFLPLIRTVSVFVKPVSLDVFPQPEDVGKNYYS